MTRPNPLPDSLPVLAMSSLRNHRVVIASLFLPNTAVLGESYPPTPDASVHSPLPLPDVFPGHVKDHGFKLALPPSKARTPAPILSIVEDLKDKASVACGLHVTVWSGTSGPMLIFKQLVISLALAHPQSLQAWSTSVHYSHPCHPSNHQGLAMQ